MPVNSKAKTFNQKAIYWCNAVQALLLVEWYNVFRVQICRLPTLRTCAYNTEQTQYHVIFLTLLFRYLSTVRQPTRVCSFSPYWKAQCNNGEKGRGCTSSMRKHMFLKHFSKWRVLSLGFTTGVVTKQDQIRGIHSSPNLMRHAYIARHQNTYTLHIFL